MADSQVPQDLPALPAPEDIDSRNQLRVGETKSFPELGPIVINVDGTTSQIANWSQMTEMEQAQTMRIIAARNKQRLAALKAQQQQEQ